jgi:hypothetical protein
LDNAPYHHVVGNQLGYETKETITQALMKIGVLYEVTTSNCRFNPSLDVTDKG